MHCPTLYFLFLGDDMINEQERAAYAAGDIGRADLLARIDELQRALGESVAENETLRDDMGALTDQRDEIRDELDTLRIENMRPARGIGEAEFTFDHPNGDTLTCYLEIDEGDETEPPRATLINAYLGAVDVHGLLPIPIIDQIEAEALGHSWP
jgi:hypothetical protein